MEGNARTWFTPKQKAELWERWRSGQCVADGVVVTAPAFDGDLSFPQRVKDLAVEQLVA
jgi:hypothetical protein